MERRHFNRITHQMEVKLVRRNEVISANLLDLSLSGMCISTAKEVEKGDEVDIIFTFDDGNGLVSVDLKGKVVRTELGRVAIHFSMSLESFEQLKKLISHAETRAGSELNDEE